MAEFEPHLTALAAALPPRIDDAIRVWIERTPDAPALVDASGVWRYRDLGAVVAATKDWLADRGVRPGDRVMVVGENSCAFVALFLGAIGLGAWPVLVNARLADREIDQIRAHCGARRVLYETSVSPPARAHARRRGAVAEEVRNLGPIAVEPLDQTAMAEPPAADGDEVAALVYTSGSSGRPKGVMLTHRNLLFVAAVSAAIRSLEPADRLCGALPISHIVGLSTLTIGALISGASLHLFARFNPRELLNALETDKLTVLLGNPSLYTLLRDYAVGKGIDTLDCPKLRIISTSGAPLDAWVKADVERLFGQPLHHGYGMTECGPTIAQIRPGAHRDDCSVGPLLPTMEARLVGPDGGVAPEGAAGELWVRGPNVMKGYYKDPDETASVLDPSGWLNTRDIARFEGRDLFIVGRTKDLIIRFGFNIYPSEVEGVLNSHPDIRQSAVVGRPAGEGNEEIVAFVEPMPGAAPTEADLAEYAARRLAPYKQPSRIIIMPDLPMTAGGKIAKQDIAAMALQAG